MSLRYEEKTKLLRQCFFEVQNEVGLGRQEEAYHQACKLWFEKRGLPVVSKPPHKLMLLGHEAYTLFPDFVAWNAISIELKAVARVVAASERVQLFDYLKVRGDRLGLLVNMGLDRVLVERLVYDPPTPVLDENWSYWKDHIDGADRDIGTAIRDALRAIFHEHGAGYGLEVTTRLVQCALQAKGLSVVAGPVAKAFFDGVEVDESSLDCLVVDERFVLTFTALFDTNEFNMNRGRSYMRTLKLPWGVAANFGRSKVELVALRNRKNNPRMAARNHG